MVKNLPRDLIKRKKKILDFNFVPILTVQLLKIGVQPLHGVIDYLPSPSDLDSIEGTKVDQMKK